MRVSRRLLPALIPFVLSAGIAVQAGEIRPPFDEIRIDQNLGGQLPMDLSLRDEEGRPVRLGDLFAGKPVVMTLAYARCPMLCGMVREGMAKGVRPLGMTPGREFTLLTISIDPKETTEATAAARTAALKELSSDPKLAEAAASGGWRFLSGDAAAVEALTTAAGFRYVYDPKSDQFAHSSGVMIVTPDGRLSRYLLGIEFAPRDLRLALVEASAGRIGTLADKLALLCLQYDPTTGHYGATIITVMRIGGVLTVLALSLFVGYTLFRDHRAASAAGRA